MDIRIIGNNNYLGDLQSEFFYNRGIKNIDAFLNLDNINQTYYNDFVNMNKALLKFKEHEEKNSNIVIIVD